MSVQKKKQTNKISATQQKPIQKRQLTDFQNNFRFLLAFVHRKIVLSLSEMLRMQTQKNFFLLLVDVTWLFFFFGFQFICGIFSKFWLCGVFYANTYSSG